MIIRYLLLTTFCIVSIFPTQGQGTEKNEFWVNSSLTSETFSVSPTTIGNLKNRNRIGASLGIESRKFINNYFSLDLGLQIKSFRESFIFDFNEVFITDINLHVPLMLNYKLKLAIKHFANFKLGFNGVLQLNQDAEFSVDQYKIVLSRKRGFFPNLKFGFGYRFENKKSFEVNLLYNMGFFQRKTELIKYGPLDIVTNTSTNGSFVELEVQYKLK